MKVLSHWLLSHSASHTHPIRLPGHVKSPAFELAEVLEEDRDEGCDVLRCFWGRALTHVRNEQRGLVNSDPRPSRRSLRTRNQRLWADR